jgi:amino acid permease
MHILAAAVWHYWIAVALVVPAILFAIAMIIGYLNKVSRPRYPRQ